MMTSKLNVGLRRFFLRLRDRISGPVFGLKKSVPFSLSSEAYSLNSSASHSALRPSFSPDNDHKPSVTIVVCTRNRPAQLEACLKAIDKLDPKADEVLVIDNSAGDEETKRRAIFHEARYSIEPIMGLSRARNRGMRESSCEIVAFIDDDAEPDQRWLQYLIAPFAEPAVAAVTGRIQTPDSSLGGNACEEPRFINDKTPEWFEIATFGGLGLGSNMALRKSACTIPKVFDERLGRGAPFQIAEENYAFANLLLRGFTAAFIPAATVFHPSLRRSSIEQEARNMVTFWLLLFSEFPRQRLALSRFLIKRLRRKPLAWPRNGQDPGDIINSHWLVKVKATVTGLLLFLRTRIPRD